MAPNIHFKHRAIREVISWSMCLILSLPTWGTASTASDPTSTAIKEAYQHYFGSQPPENATVEIGSRTINGVVTHYTSVGICDQPGAGCKMEVVQSYRESVGVMQVDGHFISVETIDSTGNNNHPIITPNTSVQNTTSPNEDASLPRRLDLTATIWKNKPGTNQPDLTSMLNFRPNSGPTFSQEIAPYVPGLVNAAQTSMQNLQQAMQTSMVMHQAYQASLGKLDAAAAGFRAQAASTEQAAALNQAIASISLGSIMAQTHRSERSPEDQRQLAAFRKLKADPFAYKQYELTDSGRADLQQKLSQALRQGQVREVAKLSDVGLNQTDQVQRQEFEKFMGESQLDGVVQVGNIVPKVGPAPLDDSVFQTQRMTPGGQAVRRVANLAQSYWEEQDGFRNSESGPITTYLSALSTLAWADNAIVQGHIEAGYALLDFSQSLLHGSVGFARGIKRSAVGLVKSVPELANAASELYAALRSDPRAVADAADKIISNSPQILDAMTVVAIRAGQDFVDGDAAYRGEVLGQIAGDILIGSVTGGIGSAVAKSAQGVKAINWVSKGARATMNLVARTPELTSILAKSVSGVAETAKYFTGSRGIELLKIADKQPIRAMSTLGAVRQAINAGSPRAADYIARASRSSAEYMNSPGGVERAVEAYIGLEKKIDQITPVSFEGKISRAVLREVEVNGKVIVNTESDVFKIHSGMKTGEGRFTLGGPEGNSGIYATVGDDPKAWETLIDELGIAGNKKYRDADFVMEMRTQKVENILDLADEGNLKLLGLDEQKIARDITDNLDTDVYLYSNAIGDLAQSKFDGIVYKSSKTGNSNIVIFNKGIK